MKNRYRLFRRGQIYYTHDAESGKQQSLRTTNRKEAERLLIACNEAQDNRLLNLKILYSNNAWRSRKSTPSHSCYR